MLYFNKAYTLIFNFVIQTYALLPVMFFCADSKWTYYV